MPAWVLCCVRAGLTKLKEGRSTIKRGYRDRARRDAMGGRGVCAVRRWMAKCEKCERPGQPATGEGRAMTHRSSVGRVLLKLHYYWPVFSSVIRCRQERVLECQPGHGQFLPMRLVMRKQYRAHKAPVTVPCHIYGRERGNALPNSSAFSTSGRVISWSIALTSTRMVYLDAGHAKLRLTAVIARVASGSLSSDSYSI